MNEDNLFITNEDINWVLESSSKYHDFVDVSKVNYSDPYQSVFKAPSTTIALNVDEYSRLKHCETMSKELQVTIAELREEIEMLRQENNELQIMLDQ